ncbi:hypothetical protein [uncultured Rhodospira sp.]|uniref:hypothetical protein n=1 Tax=uncultured Rhodospira sp. TaxID=1936189 RepID=UPI002614A2C3|nr:hypothetical protein [uncultured Rhodospira sp.]
MVEVKTRPLRVARVVDDYKVVINRGAEDGIKEGQRFLVYGIGDEVVDPETKETLGRLELVRGRGEVVHVQPRMATIRSIEKIRVLGARRKLVTGLASALAFGRNASTEEIEEPDHDEDMPFEDPQPGDQVKPI